jgi:hypothetical protein
MLLLMPLPWWLLDADDDDFLSFLLGRLLPPP